MFKKNKSNPSSVSINVVDDFNESLSIEEREQIVKEDFEKLSSSLISDPEKVDKIIKSIRENKISDFGVFCEITNGNSDSSVYKQYKDRCPKNKQIKIIFLRNENNGKKIKKFIDSTAPEKPGSDYNDFIENLVTYLKSESFCYEIDYKGSEVKILTYKGNVICGKKEFITSGDFYGMSLKEYKDYLLDLRITVDVLIQINPFEDELGNNTVKPI